MKSGMDGFLLRHKRMKRFKVDVFDYQGKVITTIEPVALTWKSAMNRTKRACTRAGLRFCKVEVRE